MTLCNNALIIQFSYGNWMTSLKIDQSFFYLKLIHQSLKKVYEMKFSFSRLLKRQLSSLVVVFMASKFFLRKLYSLQNRRWVNASPWPLKRHVLMSNISDLNIIHVKSAEKIFWVWMYKYSDAHLKLVELFYWFQIP